MSEDILSGLDMAETLAWYAKHEEELSKRVAQLWERDSNLEFPINPEDKRSNPDGYDRLREVIACAWRAFPETARNRMNLASITFWDAAWFREGVSIQSLTHTHDVQEALSPTAIVPSMVDYFPEADRILTDVSMFTLPHDVVESQAVRRIVKLQAAIHEIAHSVVTPEVYSARTLRLPGDNRDVSVGEFLLDMIPLFEQLPPISHYASSYPISVASFSLDSLTALSEHMCESITAYLLGFAYQPDGDGFNPFAGREEVRALVESYLHAERVS